MEHLNGHSTAQFPDIPPFPTDVPTAPLLRISLAKLVAHDPAESARLWRACTELGFFYLDVNGAPPTNRDVAQTHIDGPSFEEAASALFGVAHEFFDLSLEDKQQYDFASKGSYHGYKGHGAGIVDAKGTKDRNEFYNLAKNDILALTPTPNPAPPCVTAWQPHLHTFATQAHAVTTLLLTHLSTHLSLPPTTLANLHPADSTTDDQIRLVRSPPQPPSDRGTALGAHTDFGSVTLLFNRLGGLQILPPGKPNDEHEWLYVKPLPGHCIVNLGDAMVKLTRGVLRSNVHRVVNPPGAQGACTRFSLVYFSRPGDGVLLRALEGSDVIGEVEEGEEVEAVTAREWILRRALGRRGYGDWKNVRGTEGWRERRRGAQGVAV